MLERKVNGYGQESAGQTVRLQGSFGPQNARVSG